MPTSKYNSIVAISVHFLQHSNQHYRQAHFKLDTQYGEIIYSVDDLFNSDRSALASSLDIPSIITTKVIHLMIGADSPLEEAKLRQLFHDAAMTLKWHTYDPDNQARLTHLEHVLDDAFHNQKRSLRIVVNINGLHFKDNFAANNLDEISSTPFVSIPGTPTAGTAQTSAATPEQVVQALLNLVSPSTRVQPLGGNQQQLTGTIINPASLPADVRSRYERALQPDLILTKHDRAEFLLPDGTGNIQSAYHYMDGPHRLINRSGDVYYFSKWDDKQQKTFISRCPKPNSKMHNASSIREWYYQFHAHARTYGLYVHNYYDFRKLSGDPKGFTCGDDTANTQCDVPRLLEPSLRLWSSTIHAALQDVFSTVGSNEYKIVNRRHGLGYEALFDLLRTNHPEHDTYPSLLIKDRPSQKDRQTIADYYNEYLNYLKLRAYLSPIAVNLNDVQEREIFIGSLQRGYDILTITYDDRNSADPTKQAMYTQGNLVATLEAAAKRLPQTQIHIANTRLNSPMPKKELHYRSRIPPKRTPSTAHTPSKKINAVSFDETDPFNVPIPDGMEIFTGIRDNYIRAISAGSTFDTSRPCVACGKTGHSFDGCPILNNIEFLRRHFIGFQLFNKRHSNDSKTAPATVNQLHAEPANTSIPPDKTPATEDFHQGRE